MSSAPTAHIEIYTSALCGFCHRAKALLERKNIAYTEHDTMHNAHRTAMMKRANGQTSVPQIFINDEHIGGCDELYALEQAGTLNQKLGLS